jgi:hypothetical protein
MPASAGMVVEFDRTDRLGSGAADRARLGPAPPLHLGREHRRRRLVEGGEPPEPGADQRRIASLERGELRVAYAGRDLDVTEPESPEQSPRTQWRRPTCSIEHVAIFVGEA